MLGSRLSLGFCSRIVTSHGYSWTSHTPSQTTGIATPVVYEQLRLPIPPPSTYLLLEFNHNDIILPLFGFVNSLAYLLAWLDSFMIFFIGFKYLLSAEPE